MTKALENISINPSGEKLILGADYIQLNIEHQASKFNTIDLYDFISWVNLYEKRNPEMAKDMVIEYDHTKVCLYENLVPAQPINDAPLAELKVMQHQRLVYLMSLNKKNFGIEDFTKSMTILRENVISADYLDLMGNLKDFRLNKVIKIDRQRDKKGNFAFSCTRQRASNGGEMGKNDFEPPETLKFRVPVFEGATETADFEFDFEFDFELEGGEPILSFTLTHLTLDEQVRNAQKAIIQAKVKEIDLPSIWGNRTAKWRTDEWKYLFNRLESNSNPVRLT